MQLIYCRKYISCFFLKKKKKKSQTAKILNTGTLRPQETAQSGGDNRNEFQGKLPDSHQATAANLFHEIKQPTDNLKI